MFVLAHACASQCPLTYPAVSRAPCCLQKALYSLLFAISFVLLFTYVKHLLHEH